jgi:hypothetical protein
MLVTKYRKEVQIQRDLRAAGAASQCSLEANEHSPFAQCPTHDSTQAIEDIAFTSLPASLGISGYQQESRPEPAQHRTFHGQAMKDLLLAEKVLLIFMNFTEDNYLTSSV